MIDGKLETKLAPSPVEFAVLLPDGYESANNLLPLLLFLHGGGGDKSFLGRMNRSTLRSKMRKLGIIRPS
jgi:predicted peptidase